jgi:hypothetical protein
VPALAVTAIAVGDKFSWRWAARNSAGAGMAISVLRYVLVSNERDGLGLAPMAFIPFSLTSTIATALVTLTTFTAARLFRR